MQELADGLILYHGSYCEVNCTRMAEKGMDMKVLQYIMGHSSIKVTMNI